MSTWDPYFQQAEQLYGLPNGLLAAIAAQENVDPKHNNPLGLSTDSGVKTFSESEAPQAIFNQAKLLTNTNGPYRDFARTGSIQDLARVWSPVGAKNDIYGTNATEASGIMSNMPGYQNTPSYMTVPQTGSQYPSGSNLSQMSSWQDYYNPQPSTTQNVAGAIGAGLQSFGKSMSQSQQTNPMSMLHTQNDPALAQEAANPLAPLLALYQLTGGHI